MKTLPGHECPACEGTGSVGVYACPLCNGEYRVCAWCGECAPDHGAYCSPKCADAARADAEEDRVCHGGGER